MARTGMTTLIDTMRGLCNLGTNDYTLGTATYWSADHVQTALDRHKTTVIEDELMEVENLIGGGTTEYKIFTSHYGNFEETSGGTSIFYIEDAEGTQIGTAQWTADYANGVVTFGTTQAGSARYVTGYSYDINAAAADIWRMKAGAYAEAVDFKTDNMSVNRGDAIKQCMLMASQYASQMGVKVVDMTRDDSV